VTALSSTYRSNRRALTFVEVLIAIVIASIFLIGVVGALTAMLQAGQRAERVSDAVRQARHALERISRDLSSVSDLPFNSLIGSDIPLAVGDLVDNDVDGGIDEEAYDGQNDDGGAFVSKHVVLGTSSLGTDITERPDQSTFPEPGDGGVDEDTVFQNDTLSIASLLYNVDYGLGTFEGRDNVLMRTGTILRPVRRPIDAPVAFDVLSFSLLYFDPNWQSNGLSSPWVTEWNSAAQSDGDLRYPPTILISITVYSGDIPLSEVAPGTPLQAVTLETLATLEGPLGQYVASFP